MHALLLCLCAAAAGARPIAALRGVMTHTGGPKGDNLAEAIPDSLPNAACGYGIMQRRDWPQYALIGVSANSVFRGRPMGGCGTCVDIRCADTAQACWSKQRVLQAMVYDRCDACSPTQLNLHALAFLQLAPLDVGRTDILFQQVPCAFNGSIVVHIDEYRASGGGWLRLSLKNVAGSGSVTAVALGRAAVDGGTSGSWDSMRNTFGAVWEASEFGAPPLDLRATNAARQTLIMRNVISLPGQTGDVTTAVQFTS